MTTHDTPGGSGEDVCPPGVTTPGEIARRLDRAMFRTLRALADVRQDEALAVEVVRHTVPGLMADLAAELGRWERR